MKKNYIMPQTQAQIITMSQLMTVSGETETIIQKGDPLKGEPGQGVIA